MSREEFLAAAAALVGGGNGMLSRLARSYGFSRSTVAAISQGHRPVPARYAEVLSEALAQADQAGGLLRVVAPRLESALREAEAAGGSRVQALAAIASWAALRLTGAVR